MDMSSLQDLEMLASLMQGSSSGVTTFLNVVGVLSVLVMLVAAYVVNAYKWMFIGRKAGLQKDWMAFVPFAWTIYKLRIVGEQWWKMFFFEGWWLYSIIINAVLRGVSAGKWGSFAMVVITLYLICCVAYNVYWRFKFYTAHNIRPHMCLVVLVPGLGMLITVWDYLIAFGRNYPFTGEGTSRAVMDVVNVPQLRDQKGRPVAVTQAISPAERGAPWGAPPAAAPMGAPAAGGAVGSIAGLSGMYAGQTLPLAAGEELVIGRDNQFCNLILEQNADKVSRKHCGITFDAMKNAYLVTDYSVNGTFVEGGNRLVANLPTTLPRGTVLYLGNRENRFKLN